MAGNRVAHTLLAPKRGVAERLVLLAVQVRSLREHSRLPQLSTLTSRPSLVVAGATMIDPAADETEIARRLVTYDPRYYATYYAIDVVNFEPVKSEADL